MVKEQWRALHAAALQAHNMLQKRHNFRKTRSELIAVQAHATGYFQLAPRDR